MSKMLKKASGCVLAIVQGLNVPTREKSLSRQARGGLGDNDYASPSRHCRLTDSPASTNVALIILRAVDLAAALPEVLFEHPEAKVSVVGMSCRLTLHEIRFANDEQ